MKRDHPHILHLASAFIYENAKVYIENPETFTEGLAVAIATYQLIPGDITGILEDARNEIRRKKGECKVKIDDIEAAAKSKIESEETRIAEEKAVVDANIAALLAELEKEQSEVAKLKVHLETDPPQLKGWETLLAQAETDFSEKTDEIRKIQAKSDRLMIVEHALNSTETNYGLANADYETYRSSLISYRHKMARGVYLLQQIDVAEKRMEALSAKLAEIKEKELEKLRLNQVVMEEFNAAKKDDQCNEGSEETLTGSVYEYEATPNFTRLQEIISELGIKENFPAFIEAELGRLRTASQETKSELENFVSQGFQDVELQKKYRTALSLFNKYKALKAEKADLEKDCNNLEALNDELSRIEAQKRQFEEPLERIRVQKSELEEKFAQAEKRREQKSVEYSTALREKLGKMGEINSTGMTIKGDIERACTREVEQAEVNRDADIELIKTNAKEQLKKAVRPGW
jgi:hypothetical protein